MKSTKVLITNPPWIIGANPLKRRIGVRAGSRWPFTYESNLWGKILKQGINSKNSENQDFSWLKKKFKTNPILAVHDLLDTVIYRRTYAPYPAFMGYATTYLQSQGVEAKFYDAIALRHSYGRFFREVDRFAPQIIIQETSTPSFEIDLVLAEKLHQKGYQICLVGPHASAFAEELIKSPFVDYVLKGEYEYSSLKMIKSQKKGIYESERVVDLDALPYPYRDKRIAPLYRDYNCRKDLAFPQLWVYGGRGCAFQCEFCLWVHTMFNKRFTLRKPENILTEVEEMLRKYNFKYILFDDDCWNLGGNERLLKIADGLQKFKIPWSVMGRLDTCDKDVFNYLVDRGCTGLRLGVESLSQDLLNKTNKKLKVDFILEMINYLKELDVSIFLCFMHYILGETEKDRQIQNRQIKKIGLPFQNPPCIPFPGTPYYEIVSKAVPELKKNTRWGDYDGGKIGQFLKKVVKKYSQGPSKKNA